MGSNIKVQQRANPVKKRKIATGSLNSTHPKNAIIYLPIPCRGLPPMWGRRLGIPPPNRRLLYLSLTLRTYYKNKNIKKYLRPGYDLVLIYELLLKQHSLQHLLS